MLTRTSQRYSRVAMTLHWLVALLIVLNFAAAWVAEDMPRPDRMLVMANHKAIGLTILFLWVLQILWRLTHRPPPLLRSLQGWEKALARVVHKLFYVVIAAIPLTGWAMVSGGGSVGVFGLFSVPALPVPIDKAAAGTFSEAHELLGYVMLGLLGLHVLGALKHQFFDRDGTMARMVPFLRRPA